MCWSFALPRRTARACSAWPTRPTSTFRPGRATADARGGRWPTPRPHSSDRGPPRRPGARSALDNGHAWSERPPFGNRGLMFIELTDHLRCPADHDEAFLVLLPDAMEDRSVQAGTLGCPVCGRTFQLRNGVLDTGDAPKLAAESGSVVDADALTALVGLSGPGGYLTLVGAAGALWSEVAKRN